MAGERPQLALRIALLAAVSFAAGLACGLLFAPGLGGRAARRDPNTPYVDALSEALDLSAAQRRWLEIILAERDAKRAKLLRRSIADLAPEELDRLRAENRKADRRIEAMLTARQREIYRRLLARRTGAGAIGEGNDRTR